MSPTAENLAVRRQRKDRLLSLAERHRERSRVAGQRYARWGEMSVCMFGAQSRQRQKRMHWGIMCEWHLTRAYRFELAAWSAFGAPM